MSIAVELAELPAALAGYPWGYLVTVGTGQRAHVLAVPTDLRDGVLYAQAGRSSRANAAEHPEVTMVFPSPSPGGYSLVVDGNATVLDEHVTVRPSWAVLHRPAIAAEG